MKLIFGLVIRVVALILIAVSISYVVTNGTPRVIIVHKQSAMAAVDAKALARELLEPRSYGCLMKVIYMESRGNSSSANNKSSAKGLGQLLDSTYTNLGMRHSNDEKAQLIALLAYISRHYGSGGPCAALRHELKHHYI